MLQCVNICGELECSGQLGRDLVISGSGGDISGVTGELEQGIEQIWSTHSAFVAQLRYGKVVAWGHVLHFQLRSQGELEQCIDKV